MENRAIIDSCVLIPRVLQILSTNIIPLFYEVIITGRIEQEIFNNLDEKNTVSDKCRKDFREYLKKFYHTNITQNNEIDTSIGKICNPLAYSDEELKDRHVWAAAIILNAFIITTNIDDFPEKEMYRNALSVYTPSQFFEILIKSDPIKFKEGLLNCINYDFKNDIEFQNLSDYEKIKKFIIKYQKKEPKDKQEQELNEVLKCLEVLI